MNYSYTQISQYLTCPRRYRHRYLDGWQEKDVRAAMLFGRCFEQAVAALFRREDPAAVLFEQWTPCKNLQLTYSGNDTWDHMLGRSDHHHEVRRCGQISIRKLDPEHRRSGWEVSSSPLPFFRLLWSLIGMDSLNQSSTRRWSRGANQVFPAYPDPGDGPS